MAVVVVRDLITNEQLESAREEYRDYVKVVVDIEREILAAGGRWHADAEKILLGAGSRQEYLWGGGVDLVSKRIEFIALINMRPKYSRSQEVLDPEIRDKMEEIIKRAFGL